LVYRTLFYVNIHGSYKLSKKQSGFLAHPVHYITYNGIRPAIVQPCNVQTASLAVHVKWF